MQLTFHISNVEILQAAKFLGSCVIACPLPFGSRFSSGVRTVTIRKFTYSAVPRASVCVFLPFLRLSSPFPTTFLQQNRSGVISDHLRTSRRHVAFPATYRLQLQVQLTEWVLEQPPIFTGAYNGD